MFVQIITFFSVAYLIVRAMLERLDPSMEEAAHSLGAGKFHIFRTVTLPLLIPGIAGSFLLLFVESLADLGNPLFISGNVTVLSAQIFLAVAGEYDYQKASALALCCCIPTLIVFLVQRYYVTRRSYISVTGKPTGGQILVKEAWIRWPFIIITYLVCLLIMVLYAGHHLGLVQPRPGAWIITPTLDWWKLMVTRGVEVDPGHHLPERLCHAHRRADRHGHRLPGGAQAVQRQGRRWTLSPTWAARCPARSWASALCWPLAPRPCFVVGVLYALLALFLARTAFDDPPRAADRPVPWARPWASGWPSCYDLLTRDRA